ncbi:hypothetical protein K2173_026622 [Erythroxylum novogranatense]|uniref:Uncharacterized protein n=1 Tax=Erythroxylum novogranatense TaxID=1862640 RepID=A0AAV8TWU9_9ROSI|nr:hypothetical protein K2173_026622 [Erythroxylum novogranatense]
MDPNDSKKQTEQWTNEKHFHFLNSMEASFVRRMLENDDRFLRLDRYLPDTSESTLDLKSQRRTKQPSSETLGKRTRTLMEAGTDRRTRRISSHRHDPSQDQVVPQLGNRSGDRD